MPTFWTPCTFEMAVTEQAEQGGVRVRPDCLLWRLVEMWELQRSSLVNSVTCAECDFFASPVSETQIRATLS